MGVVVYGSDSYDEFFACSSRCHKTLNLHSDNKISGEIS